MDKTERKVETFRSTIIDNEDKTSSLDKQKVTSNSVSLGQSDTLYVEF